MRRFGIALWAVAALIGAATTAQANVITRDVVVFYANLGGSSRIFVYCLSALNPSCGTAGVGFLPDLGASDNRFPPFAVAPMIDSNGHLLVVEENTSGIPGTEDAAVVRRIEPDVRAKISAPIGRIANVALLGGFSGQPGPFAPTDAVLVHNRVLVIADAGPSSALLGANVDDGRLLRVNLATGASAVVATGLVNPSAIVADPTGQLWVADDLAGFSPARSLLLRVDPVSGDTFVIANESTGFDPVGPALDIALLPGGDVLWLGQSTGFLFYEIMRIDTSTGVGTQVALFGPIRTNPTGLSVDAGSGLVLLSGQTDPTAIDPDSGLPYGSAGALFEVDVTTPFTIGDPAANLATFANSSFLGGAVPLGFQIAPFTECNDEIDNNFLLGADFGDDPGCSGPFDVSEAFDCADTLDNDLDGIADRTAAFGREDGCELIPDPFLRDPSEEPDCADRLDNDGDGVVDYDGGVLVMTCEDDMDCFVGQRCRNTFCSPGIPAAADPGCPDFSAVREDPHCDDGIDNDLDGRTDWPADVACAGPSEDSEAIVSCNDGFDNDGDGLIDTDGGLLRTACSVATDCPVFETCEAGFCSNPVFVGRDPQCLRGSDSEAAGDCADGLDNDGDGAVDQGGGFVFAPCAVNADCQSAEICPGGGCACTDSVCFPGTPAAADPQCVGLPGDIEETTECNDGVDNDGDGLVDWQGTPGPEVCTSDADCVGAPSCAAASAAAGKPVGCRCANGVCWSGDPGCKARKWTPGESPACDDGVENETDDLARDDRIDFHGVGFFGFDFANDTFSFDAGFRLPDPGCRAAWSDNEAPECNDGLNNDSEDFGTDVDFREFGVCQFQPAPQARLHCGFDGECIADSETIIGRCNTIPGGDPDCRAAWGNSEGPRGDLPAPCRIGAELALVLPWIWWRRRRSNGAGPADCEL